MLSHREKKQHLLVLIKNFSINPDTSINVSIKEPSVNIAKEHGKRNVIWFIPSYSENVPAKVDRHFLRLICKHFVPYRKYLELFNKNDLTLTHAK